jgi:hypothetical protein
MWGRLLQRGPAFVHAKIPSGVADLGPPSALPHARRDRMGRGRRDRRSTGLTLKALLLSPGQLARRDDQPTVGRVEQAHFSVARFRLAYCFIRHPAYPKQYQWLAIYQQVTASYVSAKSRGGPACQRGQRDHTLRRESGEHSTSSPRCACGCGRGRNTSRRCRWRSERGCR